MAGAEGGMMDKARVLDRKTRSAGERDDDPELRGARALDEAMLAAKPIPAGDIVHGHTVREWIAKLVDVVVGADHILYVYDKERARAEESDRCLSAFGDIAQRIPAHLKPSP